MAKGPFDSTPGGSFGPEGPAPGPADTWPTVTPDGAPPRDDDRYERAGVLGRGGMGRVWLATDRRLDRTVALKEALRGGPVATRLAREAKVTAGLDHPGIVAVHDAGLTADGLPFYTMPVVRGRSLDAVLADTPTPAARLGLVRAFLQVCQAVAYAHAQGVIHRDLKPANVLLGPFGETRVADWGLAARLGEGEGPTEGAPADDALTHAGEVMGTPAYMSPEQARGAPADRRSDVWGLGAVLYEILAGSPPIRGTTSVERLEAARRGAAVPIEEAAPGAPRELMAIVHRALRPDPAERYPDAGALAVDVEAWVDGRPVAAHTYSPRELLARFVQTYRLPLLVAGVALAVLTGAQAWSNLRLRAQRDRAEAAEGTTRAALEAADAGLAQALLQQATAAMEAGAVGRAEVLAAASLRRVDSPGARGVLAGAATAARPTRLEPLPLPTCREIALAGIDRVVCATDTEVTLWESGAARWTIPARDASLLVDGDQLWIAEGEVGTQRALADGAVLATMTSLPGVSGDRRHLTAMNGTPAGRSFLGCGEARVAAAATSPRAGRMGIVCHDGRVGSAPIGVPPVPTLQGPPLDTSRVHHTALAGTTLLVASVKGELTRIDLRDGTGATLPRARATGLRGLRVSPDNRLFLEIPERGDVIVRSVADLAEVARVPAAGVRDAWVGPEGLAVAEEDRVTRWRLPDVVAVHAIPNEGGLSTVAVSRDGRRLATGNSQGEVVIRSLPDGAVVARHPAGVTTVKHLVATDEGFAWVGAGAPPVEGGRLWTLEDAHGEPRSALPPETVAAWQAQGFDTLAPPILVARRLARVATGWLILPYEPDVLTTDLAGAPVGTAGCAVGDWVDLSPTPDGRSAWLLDVTGLVARYEAGTCTLAPARGARAIAALGGGFVSADGDSLVAHDADGKVRWRAEHLAAAGPTDLAASPDGRWVAAAGLDHLARVYDGRDGRLQGVLEGAAERVSAVAFAGDRLVTASWDGSVRLWDLPTLDAPADALLARTRAAWNLEDDAPTR